jgi:SPFH domain/Band 7 family protein
VIIPFIDVLNRVSLRIVTMPIQSQGIITRDNVSVDVSAVAYFRVVDAVKSVVAIENVAAAINQIAQTTLRKVVGQHTLDETLSETDHRISQRNGPRSLSARSAGSTAGYAGIRAVTSAFGGVSAVAESWPLADDLPGQVRDRGVVV